MEAQAVVTRVAGDPVSVSICHCSICRCGLAECLADVLAAHGVKECIRIAVLRGFANCHGDFFHLVAS